MPRRLNTLALKLVVLGGVAANQAFSQSANLSPNPYQPDTPGASQAATDLRVFGTNPDSWLFPITSLNKLLPHWIQFGGQFRDRMEGQTGLGYAPVNEGVPTVVEG